MVERPGVELVTVGCALLELMDVMSDAVGLGKKTSLPLRVRKRGCCRLSGVSGGSTTTTTSQEHNMYVMQGLQTRSVISSLAANPFSTPPQADEPVGKSQ